MDLYSAIQNIWIIIVIWSFIYLSDYYLTIYSAKMQREYLQEHISYGGSFELTPQFQKDIDAFRLVSPQFLIRWLLSLLFIYIFWWLSIILKQPRLFYFLVGALILREVAVHLRHFRNLAVYFNVKNGGGLKGKIEYSRWFVLKISAAEFLSFCFVYLVFAIFFSSWFFLGGTFGCLVIAFQHWRLSKRAVASSQVVQDGV